MPVGEATKQYRLDWQRRRYAEDAEYRESRKALSRKAFQALTPEERLERGRQARGKADPEVTRTRKRAEQRQVRLDVVEGYGGRCGCCGAEYPPHLTIDHVNGGGTVERKTPGQNLLRRLRREGFPGGYRVLCWNCNRAAHASGEHRCACSD